MTLTAEGAQLFWKWALKLLPSASFYCLALIDGFRELEPKDKSLMGHWIVTAKQIIVYGLYKLC